jgi:hypothetical protein
MSVVADGEVGAAGLGDIVHELLAVGLDSLDGLVLDGQPCEQIVVKPPEVIGALALLYLFKVGGDQWWPDFAAVDLLALFLVVEGVALGLLHDY